MIPLLAASEKGKGRTESLVERLERCGLEQWLSWRVKIFWKGIP
jgi:hypothetical protein